jgi:4a-hydroxytetrahydrobiopterin dehydratase
VAELLTRDEIGERLGESEWSRDGDGIVRDLKFADFRAAVDFVNRVAKLAEDANHHPDISIHGWNHVSLRLSTHSAGGLTGADFALAERIDAARA